MAAQDIYIDVARGAFVSGLDSATLISPPLLVRGTTPTLHVYLLAQTAGWPVSNPPYSFIPVAGLTLEMAVGQLGAGAYLANQFTWTASTDLADPYFTSTLSLNTTAIAAALGVSRQITAVMQVDSMTLAGMVPTTVLLANVTIQNAIIVPGATLAAPDVIGTYLTRTIVGHLTLVNDTDPTKQVDLYVGSDGPLHEDPIA